MSDIEKLLDEPGPWYGRAYGSECDALWRSSTSAKGYVQVVPPEPGVVWAPRAEVDAVVALLKARQP